VEAAAGGWLAMSSGCMTRTAPCCQLLLLFLCQAALVHALLV
jgi:hypothetical protein